ncbi:putative flavin-containing monooxygenase protein [Botrytis fragariae]|uniref:Putative flavin-containing monooxygenase protein n=1 Tax=Botrytis fragariae TaxID=1964551 RepID=A0A8H6EL45_9HELO|nr:putative flavin-containing monooxygenase protein [Botrytis fragariae]KAF5875880.1 putative flavin-containing monooxygenase protein [Botrytis fragariae]
MQQLVCPTKVPLTHAATSQTTMVTVAIIGAGPAGLVAAKTLLKSSSQDSIFQVTVFEQGTDVGGLWAVESNPNGIINPEMHTNLSQFTVCFSDLAWDSVEMQPPANIYPKAWQVHRYLKEYSARYIPAGTIAFQTCVKVIEHIQTSPEEATKKWKITSLALEGETPIEKIEIFDYLIIASGFFSQARKIPFPCTNLIQKQDGQPSTILHSSQYRQLSDLSPTQPQPLPGKILIIGGSHSGAEVASLIAMQISDAQYSSSGTGTGTLPTEIIHVMPHPLVSIPSFVRSGNEKLPSFVQLDSRLYDLSSRPEGPILFTFGLSNAEKRKKLTDTLNMLMSGTVDVGNDDEVDLGAPYAVVGDKYAEFIRSGAIKQVFGRISQLEPQTQNSSLMLATIESQSEQIKIEEIAAVVYATGFSTSPVLNFLLEEIKESLGYNASYPRLPLLLNEDCMSSSRDSPSNLALMGFFDGSYWGILESQARVIARKWGKQASGLSSPAHDREEIDDDDSSNLRAFMKELRIMMDKDPSSVPQNFFSDYPGLMEETARKLGLQKINLSWGEREGMVSPARYVDSQCNITEAQIVMQKLQKTLQDSRDGKAIFAKSTFRGLQGNWKDFSAKTEFPESSPKSSSSFHPRYPTDTTSDLEYLCITQCEESSNPLPRSIYRLRESANQIEVWSVDSKSGSVADKKCYVLDFNNGIVEEQTDVNRVTVVAKGSPDVDLRYRIIHSFCFAGVGITEFKIEYFDEENVKVDSGFHFVR